MRVTVAAILLSLFLLSCGATIRSAANEVPHVAVPIAIDETLNSLEDARTRERVARVMETPEMQRAIREFGTAVVQGALESTTEQAMKERLQGLATALADEFVHALAEQFSREVIPSARASLTEPLSPEQEKTLQEVKGQVQALWAKMADDFARALSRELTGEVIPAARASLIEPPSPEQQKAMGNAFGVLAADMTRSALRAAAEEMPLSLGPALRRSVTEELGSPELREAIAQAMADVTRETLIRSRAVIKEMQMQPHEPGLIERLDRLVRLAWTITIGVAIGLVVLFLRALSVHRKDEASRREAAAELASRAMDAAKGKPWAGELGDLLNEQLRGAESIGPLRRGPARRRWGRGRRAAGGT